MPRLQIMRLVILISFALIFPPLGVVILLAYLGKLALDYVARDGGPVTRRRMETWSAAGPPPVTDPIELRLREQGLA